MDSSFIDLVFAAIPAPPGNGFSLGPLNIRAYGMMIAMGVLAGVELSRRRWKAIGGREDDIIDIAYRVVPAGLIGTRIYHLITDWPQYVDRPFVDLFKIWNGGLGIPGGIVLGCLVGWLYAKKRGFNVPVILDTVIPGLPLAQAIGRIGNWWNQEIFGKPTDLPWGLEVDPEFRPSRFADATTFHPAFLYEVLWNLGLAAFILFLDKKDKLKTGQILPLYILGYGVGRFLVESVRDDFANRILDIRVNHWVSGFAVLVGAYFFYRIGKRDQSEVSTKPYVKEQPAMAEAS